MRVVMADEVVDDWPMTGFHIAVEYMPKECATRYFVRDDAHPRSEAVFVLTDYDREDGIEERLNMRWLDWLTTVSDYWYGGDDGS